VRTLYDPACGTGGVLSVAEDYLRDLNPGARLEVFGQELNDETYAICRSDMMLKGQDASHIVSGNSFSEDDEHKNRKFDCMLANPPFGVEWKSVEKVVKEERGARLPRSLRRRTAGDQRRELPLPPAHDLEDEAGRAGRLAACHRFQRLAALHRQRRLGPVRDPSLDH
jgi:methylase of polypeptide subunit release factors